ncbi:MAG: threonine ammonia-lyase [Methanomassiliicoccales archaeon]
MKSAESFPVTYQDIEDAVNRLRGVINRTPFEFSASFSKMVGAAVYLKMENLQKTGSFKIRGAFNKISRLTEAQRERGVITASAGNHAQGVALSASLNGIKSVVVMPQYASLAKIAATKNYGAEVILHGQTFDDALSKAKEVQQEQGLTFVHGYNDPLVIAGQGTIGIEVCEENELDYFIVPVGGGGLISGIALAIKQISPKTKIIGVQAESAPSFAESFRQGRQVAVRQRDTIADGIAIKHPGEIAFSICKALVDDILTVSEDEIVEAMFLLLERSKLLVEGAGAAPLALLLSRKFKADGKKIGVLLSGGNVDLNLTRKMILRGMTLQRRIALLQISVPDRPGAMREALSTIADAGATVLSLYENQLHSSDVLNRFTSRVLIELEDAQHLDKLIEALDKKGIEFKLLKD